MSRFGTSVWTAVAVAVALPLSAGAWSVSSRLATAVEASGDLTKIEREAADAIVFDSTNLGALGNEVAEVERAIGPAHSAMGWVWRLTPALSPVPGASRELAAWASQVERAHRDVEVARELMESGRGFWGLYDDAQAALQVQGVDIAELKLEAERLSKTYEDAGRTLSTNAQLGRAYGLALKSPLARDLRSTLNEVEQEIAAASKVGQQATALLAELLDMANHAQPLVAQFRVNGSEPATWSADELKAAFVNVQERSDSARRR